MKNLLFGIAVALTASTTSAFAQENGVRIPVTDEQSHEIARLVDQTCPADKDKIGKCDAIGLLIQELNAAEMPDPNVADTGVN